MMDFLESAFSIVWAMLSAWLYFAVAGGMAYLLFKGFMKFIKWIDS